MIINEKIVKDIFNLKLKIMDKKEKILLSEYNEFIPMYDIYSNQLYLVNKNKLHFKLIDDNYRFIGKKIENWFKIQYEKFKKNSILQNQYKIMLDIINNYDLNILIDTSYKTLYTYSPYLGLSISICKRNSFNKFSNHINPYYSKIELIKLGENMGIKISKKEKSLLFDEEQYLDICRKISNNDVSNAEIVEHSKHIINEDIISWISFYSFYGSYLLNGYLRHNKQINQFLYNGLTKLINAMKTSPSLHNNYFIYRFVWEDSFLSNLKINDIFSDAGFLSTTRDPFYKPATQGRFGLILIKIYIPQKKGYGLFMENFSLFPKEEEFILPPNTKLKLVAKNDNFKYYHINPTFEKLINKKYEFKIVSIDYKKYLKNLVIADLNQKVINDFKNYTIDGIDRLNLIKKFIEGSDIIVIKLNNKEYTFYYSWFDSITSGAYSKLYYNKIKDGIMFSLYENGYPYLNIEVGKEMIINYINKFYFYKNIKTELNEDLLDLILEFGRIFYFKTVKIFHNYRNFSEFNKKIEFEYYNQFYNQTIYNFLKFNKKYLNYSYIKYSWKNLSKLLNSKLPEQIIFKYFENIDINFKTIGEGYLYLIKSSNFELSNKYLEDNEIDDTIIYLTYNIYDRLENEKRYINRTRILRYEDRSQLNSSFKFIDQDEIYKPV